MPDSQDHRTGEPLSRIAVLDGWRAFSIFLVLIGHLLPLGPAWWLLNGPVTATGMALFFALSGFLITRILAHDAHLKAFLARRFVRIVPLAWLCMVVGLPLAHASFVTYVSNFLFTANLPPSHLTETVGHLWSVCVEAQFYLFVALLVALGGRRSLYVLPLLCLVVTGIRIAAGARFSVVTWWRVDEILAGATLALVYDGWFGARPIAILRSIGRGIYLLIPLLLASGHYFAGPLPYARPYLAALVIGASLYDCPGWLSAALKSRCASYLATISYALYVIHGLAGATWLASGDKLVKYMKRPLLVIVVFALAHLSTFYFERPLLKWVKRATGPETR